MDIMIEMLIEKFISGKRLSKEESDLLNKMLNNLFCQKEINQYLENTWHQSIPETVSLKFEKIQENIRIPSYISAVNRLVKVLIKVAAVLFIPILVASLCLHLYTNHSISKELLTLSTRKGEQTNIILPDGSKVWLNVNTTLSYPVNYGKNSRNLELNGEAYFEIEKNVKLPFSVTSGNITTNALGTRFIVSASSELSETKSSLIDGSVEIEYMNNKKILLPGQQFSVNKNSSAFSISSFNLEYELAWKDKQLVFCLTPFDNVIKKLEEWYDIDIEYNPALFKSETLTVRFEKYETMENVLKVISKATGFKYVIEGKYVIIKK